MNCELCDYKFDLMEQRGFHYVQVHHIDLKKISMDLLFKFFGYGGE